MVLQDIEAPLDSEVALMECNVSLEKLSLFLLESSQAQVELITLERLVCS